jgi:hypothetical protein
MALLPQKEFLVLPFIPKNAEENTAYFKLCFKVGEKSEITHFYGIFPHWGTYPYHFGPHP